MEARDPETFDLDFSLIDLSAEECSLDQKTADRNKFFESRRATAYENKRDYPQSNAYFQTLLTDFNVLFAVDKTVTNRDIEDWRKEKNKVKQERLRKMAILHAQLDGIVAAWGYSTRSFHQFDSVYFAREKMNDPTVLPFRWAEKK